MSGIHGLRWGVRVLIIYAGLVPFYYLPPISFAGTSIPVLKYLPTLGCCVLALMGAKHLSILTASRAGKTVLILAALYTIQMTLGSVVTGNWLGLGRSVHYAATGVTVMVLVPVAFREARELHGLLSWVALIGTAISVYGVIEVVHGSNPLFEEWYLSNNPYFTPDQATSTVGNPIPLATLLCMSMPLCVQRYESSPRPLERMGWLVAAGAHIACVLFALSRGGWAVGGMVLVAVLLYRPVRRRLSEDRQYLLTTGVCLLLGWSVVWGGMRTIGLQERTSATDVTDLIARRVVQNVLSGTSLAYRLSQYRVAGEMLRSSPLIGVGTGRYTEVRDNYVRSDVEAHGGTVKTADNMYLIMLAERGVLGVAIFAILCGYIWIGLIRHGAGIPEARPGQRRTLALSLLACGAMFLEWDGLYHPVIRTYFWLFQGVAFALLLSTENEVGGDE